MFSLNFHQLLFDYVVGVEQKIRDIAILTIITKCPFNKKKIGTSIEDIQANHT
jgi:hypothetical protein